LDTIYAYLIPIIWLVWLGYWFAAARDVKATARHESFASRMAHIVPLIIAVALFWLNHLPLPLLYARFLPATALGFWIGTAIVVAGLAFAIWARVFLGRNWSGTVTLKEQHELIRGGPYRWVRHPIYTGLLFAFLGSAIALGQYRGLLAVLIVFVALWRKLRMEERWLTEIFGDQYVRYRREVAALVPFLL
jgi:protein-S-isoprenylcysteine O-methyltransferase Ste14